MRWHGVQLFALVEEGFEAGVAGAADGQAGAIGENGQAAVFAIGLLPQRENRRTRRSAH